MRSSAPGRRGAMPSIVALACALWWLLASCTSDITTPGEALRIVGSDAAPAYVGIAYEEPIHAVGGLRPYDFSIVDGSLPAGLSLEGGTLRGTPTATGSATFTVQVSDGNLSKTVRKFTIRVTEIPPPSLTLNAPLTQVQRRTTLRAKVLGARSLEGVSTRVTWNADLFQLVDKSLVAARSTLALLSESGKGWLQVDVVPLGTVLDGDVDLFRFDLEPVAQADLLQVDLATVFVSTGRRTFAKAQEGRAPVAEAPSGTAEPGAPGPTNPPDGAPPSPFTPPPATEPPAGSDG